MVPGLVIELPADVQLIPSPVSSIARVATKVPETVTETPAILFWNWLMTQAFVVAQVEPAAVIDPVELWAGEFWPREASANKIAGSQNQERQNGRFFTSILPE